MQRYVPTLAFLLLLLIGDLAFIGLHVLHVWSPWLPQGAFSIERDNGMAEVFQYIKQMWLCASLALLALITRGRSFIAWALFFFYLLVDDALTLHERIGFRLGQDLGLPAIFGLRPDDLGELMVAGAVGGALIVFVAIVLRTGSANSRRLCVDLLCLVGALALFGVAIDALHTITYFSLPAIAPVFALIEDGGEMFIMSALIAYAFDALIHHGELRVPVWEWVRGKVGLFSAKVVPAPARD